MSPDAIFGFTGKILEINLTEKKLGEITTPIKWARKYVGGSGLAARILFPLLRPDIDPLSPDNPLLLMAGPFTGTKIPCGSRLTICARSPLTKLWGECSIGGSFGARLRHAGFDGILIKGRANKPTLLTVLNDQVELRAADSLWNLGINDTIAHLHKDIASRQMASLAIGPAGENLVKYANIMSEGGRAAGRMGLGAVMGSKQLKAIVAVGNKSVPVAKPDELSALVRTATKVMMEDFQIGMYQEMGTAAFFGAAQEMGAAPNKYWTQGEWEPYDNISGSTMVEKITKGNSGCYLCPIRCGRVIEIPEGKYKLPEESGPEYETLAALGSMILCDDLKAVSYAAHLCDDLGLDTISCGTTIGFAYFLMEKNLLTPKEVGMALEWGRPEAQHELIRQIAYREGFGDVLAEGTRELGERYNAGELAIHVKGLEPACWGPRALFGQAAAFATSVRGAHHLDADMYWVLNGQVIPELGIDADDPQTDEGMGRLTAITQNWRMVTNSLMMCLFATFTVHEIVQFYTFVTGIPTSPEKLMLMGERIFNLKRLINLKLGATPKDDTLPPLLLRPLETGGTQGKVPDLKRQLSDYYTHRDWDVKTGYPSKEKLAELELSDLVA
ncbi:MAG: aldehyde ferredoxin oxidoreductase family protein [Promethearchaeota archaeon]